jgi:hypothetical protein
MAKVIHAPDNIDDVKQMSIFLAGTIDMGDAPEWQRDIVKEWDKFDVVFFNPRRPDWDSDFGSKEVLNQVNWELDAMDKANIILVNILEESESPITIAETYRHAGSAKLFVACPKGFYRYDNIKAVCEHYKSPLYNSWDELKEDFEKNMDSLIEAWEFTNQD